MIKWIREWLRAREERNRCPNCHTKLECGTRGAPAGHYDIEDFRFCRQCGYEVTA